MKYYVDKDENEFLEENVEAVIELIKKAYLSTKEFYKTNTSEDFLYMNVYRTFNKGYCFYFARMLKSIYKNAKFIVADKNYAYISHILILINDNMYDINGKKQMKKYYILTNKELEIINLNHNVVDEDIYQTFKNYFHKYLDDYIEYNINFVKEDKLYK